MPDGVAGTVVRDPVPAGSVGRDVRVVAVRDADQGARVPEGSRVLLTRRWCRIYGCSRDVPDQRAFCDFHAHAGGEQIVVAAVTRRGRTHERRERILDLFDGPTRQADLIAAGIPRWLAVRTIREAYASGAIERIGHGLYRRVT